MQFNVDCTVQSQAKPTRPHQPLEIEPEISNGFYRSAQIGSQIDMMRVDRLSAKFTHHLTIDPVLIHCH